MNQKKVGIVILVSDQVFSKIGTITHDNEESLVMIKMLYHPESLTNFNYFNNRASKYMMQKFRELKREIN